ncbi:MAG: hypothetical protein JKY96_04470 [Phycisphaerales bacterium]|nr:hypothetical protein [Phycisphaerales bacterium]
MAVTTRSVKGAPLTHAELDANFTTLDGDITAVGLNNVVGPAVATDNALVRFNLSTGKLVENGQTIEDDSGNVVIAGTLNTRTLAADSSKLDAIEASADVTDTANVTTAGALMDSEVSVNLKTLTLPASATLSTYGITLTDDADAPTARKTLETGEFDLKTTTALSDAAATLTAAQLRGGEFTITPTVARIQTTDTATAIVAAITGSIDNSNFLITIVNLAAFDVTLAAGVGVTLVGGAVINNGSATWRVRRTSATTVTIVRM